MVSFSIQINVVSKPVQIVFLYLINTHVRNYINICVALNTYCPFIYQFIGLFYKFFTACVDVNIILCCIYSDVRSRSYPGSDYCCPGTAAAYIVGIVLGGSLLIVFIMFLVTHFCCN